LVEERGLAGPEQVKTLRAQDAGEPIVTDGPFPETKEVLAGYWVVQRSERHCRPDCWLSYRRFGSRQSTSTSGGRHLKALPMP
jgi:hypothetical protein